MSSQLDGKYLLLCTDESLSAKEATNLYLEKDFIEKVFRSLKTDIDLQPVRHRLAHRVRAYLFVCVLAHFLWAALRWRLIEGGIKENEASKYASDLMTALERVERMEVQLGNEVRTWYLNVTKQVKEGLRRLKMKDLLKEETRFVQPM